MSKVKPDAGADKPLGDDVDSPGGALEQLARALATWTESLGVAAPPSYVLNALAGLRDAIGALEPPEAPVVNSRSKSDGGWRRREYDEGLGDDTDTSRNLQRGRHDEKALPAGFTYEHGHLMGPPMVFKSPDPRTVAAAKSLLLSLACQFSLADSSGKPHQLYAHIQRQVKAAAPSGRLHRRAVEVEAAYEAYFGQKFGTPAWIGGLIAQLEMDARHREAERQRRVRGDEDPAERMKDLVSPEFLAAADGIQSGALHASASGAAILAFLRENNYELPSQLTAEVIENMRAVVGINGRGRGGKRTATSVVRAFAKGLEAGRGNS